jgi:4-diphosphocytidyl-2-C-methyl-D-erythritol kinase
MHIRVYCPAKVNLFLAVGPRDARGYHPLRTIFQAIDLCDMLEVEFGSANEPRIEIVGTELPEENTLTKTLRLSREIFALQPERIRLTKNIPMQSGLGGGSSDAAGLLRAFSALRPVSRPEMESVAAAVGADVPFFLTGGRAKGEHYGEQISPLPDGPEEWYLIVKPPVGCSTVEMYAKLDEKPREWRDWPEGNVLYNDFERVAPCECLDLIEMLQMLGAKNAGLSGSGSAVFGSFASVEEAERASQQVTYHKWVAKGLTRTESLKIERLA